MSVRGLLILAALACANVPAHARKPGQAPGVPFGVAELGDQAAAAAREVVGGFALPANAVVTVTVRGALRARDAAVIERAVIAALPGAVADRAGDPAAARAAGAAATIEIDVGLGDQPGQARVVVRARRLTGLSIRVLVRRERWLARREAVWAVDADAQRALGAPVAGRLPGKPRRAELDLGAELLALAIADLDGDGDGELVALTTDALVWLEPHKKGWAERARVALGGAPPVPRPRVTMGTLVAADTDGDGRAELYARTSTRAAAVGARLDGSGGALALAALPAGELWPLVALAPAPGAPATVWGAALDPGTHVFTGASWAVFAGATPRPRAAADAPPAAAFSSPAARPERFVAATSAPRAAGSVVGFVAESGATILADLAADRVDARLGATGAAIALVDVDRDGRVEAATTAHAASGDGDRVVLVAVDASGKPGEAWRAAPTQAGVAALAAGDLGGDGLDDLAWVVRLPGATRVTLWVAE